MKNLGSEMGDRNFNSILPPYINSKIIRYFSWTPEVSESYQNPISSNQKVGAHPSSVNLNTKFSGTDNLHLLDAVKNLTTQVSDNSRKESLESVKRFVADDESVTSKDTDSNTIVQQNIISDYTADIPAAEPSGNKRHSLFRNIVYTQKKNHEECLDKGLIITELHDSQKTSLDEKCSLEEISRCTEEIMPNPFRRNSSAPTATPPAPPQVIITAEWTRQVELVLVKFAESLPTSLRNQTTLNIAITVGFTLIAWLFLSWLTQLIVSFICVSAAVFFLSAILSPQTNSWFIANFILTHMDNLRLSASDLFLNLGEWLRSSSTHPNQNQIQRLSLPPSIQNQNQNRRASVTQK